MNSWLVVNSLSKTWLTKKSVNEPIILPDLFSALSNKG